jgi:signal transduction histidine kinase
MRHRIAALGGSWDVRSPGSGGTVVTALIPLSRMLLTETA